VVVKTHALMANAVVEKQNRCTTIDSIKLVLVVKVLDV